MRLNDIIPHLVAVTGISKVINDGRFVPVLMEDRTFNEMPFIEIVETNVDRTEHNSTDWIRWGESVARLFVKREIDDHQALLQLIEDAFDGEDQVTMVIGQPEAYNDFVYNIDIAFRYYESVSKS